MPSRLSSSPASGPSSSLRYTSYGYAQSQPPPLSPISSGPPGASSSQLSYTKRSVPSPTSMKPPVSALSAMQITATSPPSASPVAGVAYRPTSPLQTQPVPMPAHPGSSGLPLSSSPTPSLTKRYSSSRYSRSFGRESASSSSPGEHGSYWPADRRSRLSSTTSRDGGNSAAPATRQLGSGTGTGGPLTQAMAAAAAASAPGTVGEGTPPGDADDIKSFLGLIDSRAQLPSGSVLLRKPMSSSAGGSSLGSSPGRGAGNRLALEERMRSLADSVYRDPPTGSSIQQRPPSPSLLAQREQRSPGPSSLGSTSGAARIMQYTSRAQRTAMAAASTGHSPSSFPPPPSSAATMFSARQTPSPDLQTVEGETPAFLSTASGGSIRQRAWQAPISTSIPEEDLPLLAPASRGREAISQASSMSGLDAIASGTTSGSGHFPFPRYVSSAMRRRESGASTSSGTGTGTGDGSGNISGSGRPSILPSPIATAASSGIMPTPAGCSGERRAGASTFQFRASLDAEGNQMERDPRRSMDSTGSGYSPRPSEDAEEQTMGQLELGSASDIGRQQQQ